MDKEYIEYVEVLKELEVLEKRRDEIRAKIIASMKEDTSETEFGTFTRAHRSTWAYSDKVDALTQKVKLQQVKEQKNGTAKETITTYLRFTPKKEN